MKRDYTTVARRIYLKHPLISDIWTQINFWIVSYVIFFSMLYFIAVAITGLYIEDVKVSLSSNLLVALISAVFFGTALGTTDFFLEKILRGRSLGIEIIAKGVAYLIIWNVVSSIAYSIGTTISSDFIQSATIEYTDEFSFNILAAASIYTAIMIFFISFIKQMNKKFGPGMLIPMFFGKFRKPHRENRVFLFMDLKDSTSYAERLGSIKYSQLIQDCFLDVNRVIPPFNAEIYQYVGDEVVLSWMSDEGIRNMNCIKFFFAFQNQLESKRSYYESKYDCLPQFKAGANIGEITVAEVGDIKREIAYHGDTINTAARIQSVCNEYGKTFLISGTLKESINWEDNYSTELLGSIALKGKQQEIKLFALNESNSQPA